MAAIAERPCRCKKHASRRAALQLGAALEASALSTRTPYKVRRTRPTQGYPLPCRAHPDAPSQGGAQNQGGCLVPPCYLCPVRRATALAAKAGRPDLSAAALAFAMTVVINSQAGTTADRFRACSLQADRELLESYTSRDFTISHPQENTCLPKSLNQRNFLLLGTHLAAIGLERCSYDTDNG